MNYSILCLISNPTVMQDCSLVSSRKNELQSKSRVGKNPCEQENQQFSYLLLKLGNNLCRKILSVSNVENCLQTKKFKLTSFIVVIIFSLRKPGEIYIYFRSCNLRSDLALNWQRRHIFVKADNVLSKVNFSHSSRTNIEGTTVLISWGSYAHIICLPEYYDFPLLSETLISANFCSWVIQH